MKTLTLLFIIVTAGQFAAEGAAENDPISAVQRALKAQGFYHGVAEGRVDQETRDALQRYQIRRGLKVSGEMDTATLEALAKEPPVKPEEASPAAAASGKTESARERARNLERSDREFLSNLEAAERTGETVESGPAPAPLPPAKVRPSVAVLPEAPPTVAERPGGESGELTQEEVARYVEKYLEAAEGATPEKELSFFADRVDYFDSGRVAQKFIRADQLNYYRRWPRREFTLLGTPQIEWTEGDRTAVRFRIRYELSSARERTRGATENLMQVRRGSSGLEIVGLRERKVRE